MSEDPSSQGSAPAKPQPRRSAPWVWPLAIVLICAMAFGLLYRCMRISGEVATKVADRLAVAFKPTVSFSTVLYSSLDHLTRESKLVVLTAEVTVQIEKESQSEWKVFGMAIPRGTTRVLLRAPGNKVQFVVPLQGVKAEDFRYDSMRKRLVLSVPSPVVDPEVVEVQNDPSKIELKTDVGWGRLDRYSGQFLRDQARQELRPTVIQEASQEYLQSKAQTNAIQALKKMLEPLAADLQPGVELDIEFRH